MFIIQILGVLKNHQHSKWNPDIYENNDVFRKYKDKSVNTAHARNIHFRISENINI